MSGFTCISCRVAFDDPENQRSHYKTDWHRYNLKRKVADMPPVTAENFRERVLAQKAETEEAEKDGSSQCQICSKNFNSKNAFDNHIKSKKHREAEARKAEQDNKQASLPEDKAFAAKEEEKNRKNAALKRASEAAMEVEGGASGSSAAGPSTSTEGEKGSSAPDMEVEDDDSDAESWESWEGEALGLEDCLFCPHVSETLDKNLHHMTTAHSFFLPDLEYVCDLEGLLCYLGEKVGEGHICLWCNERSKSFRSTQAVQQHMTDKGHCKLLHDGDTVFEYADFYDYSSSYPDFDPTKERDEGESDEEIEQEELSVENYEMVLPSGAVIGHRSLQRYYRQKLRPERQVAVRNPNALSRVMAQYKALGWTGTTGPLAQKKAKDISFIRRMRLKNRMQIGVKANKLQHHFRRQVTMT